MQQKWRVGQAQLHSLTYPMPGFQCPCAILFRLSKNNILGKNNVPHKEDKIAKNSHPAWNPGVPCAT